MKILLNAIILFLILFLLFQVAYSFPQNSIDFNIGIWNAKISGYTQDGKSESEIDLRDDNAFPNKNICIIGLDYRLNNKKSISAKYLTDKRNGFNISSRPITISGRAFPKDTRLSSGLSMSVVNIMYKNSILKRDKISLKSLLGIYYINYRGYISGLYSNTFSASTSLSTQLSAENGYTSKYTMQNTSVLPSTKIYLPIVGLGIDKQVSKVINLSSEFMWFEGHTQKSDGRLSEINIGTDYLIKKNISISLSYKSTLVNGMYLNALGNIKYNGFIYMVETLF